MDLGRIRVFEVIDHVFKILNLNTEPHTQIPPGSTSVSVSCEHPPLKRWIAEE
jgi:hypothetical protein